MKSQIQGMSRCAELQARCEAQRTVLAEQLYEIENRLEGTDRVMGAISNVMSRPALLAGGAAMILAIGRGGWWSRLSRGVVLFATARRAYQLFKKQ